MPRCYQDIYPEKPLINSAYVSRPLAKELVTLEYFESKAGVMPKDIFSQHHILINLQDEPHRVENWRDDQHRDFLFKKNEIIITPATVQSGWKWHAKSKVIVITLKPERIKTFTQNELGILLTDKQFQDVPQCFDEDIAQESIRLMNAVQNDISSAVMFENLASIFVIKLIQKYGSKHEQAIMFTKSFTPKHYKRIVDYIDQKFRKNISLVGMAKEAGLSSYHFARIFKQATGQSPYQFVMMYRIEQSKKLLAVVDNPIVEVAYRCGFSDQAHFSRIFKKMQGCTPNQWRQSCIGL